jgi:hypothetical protein
LHDHRKKIEGKSAAEELQTHRRPFVTEASNKTHQAVFDQVEVRTGKLDRLTNVMISVLLLPTSNIYVAISQ